MNILDTPVSCFNSVRSSKPSCIVNLLDWVTSDIYKKEIEKLRKIKGKEQRDNEKKKLPAITPSGVFEAGRKINYLAQHSGIISIDIDHKDNKYLTSDLEKLKARLSQIPEVAFCGLSVSGKGLYVLVPIEHTEVHRLYFEALKHYFHKSLGIVIDKGCGDVSRLRTISYDSSYYLNKNAMVFNKLYKTVSKPTTGCLDFSFNASKSIDRLQEILAPVFTDEIDVTQTRDDWFKLCCVIVNTCGESGRAMFHYISSFNSKYSRKECDAMYDDLLKRPPYNYGLGTVVHIVKQYV